MSVATSSEHLTDRDLLLSLHGKIDALSARVERLAARQDAWDELRRDLIPVINEAYAALVEELASIDSEFTIDDGRSLVRKLLRNTRLLSELLDDVKSWTELANDLRPLGKEVLGSWIERLDSWERKNVFVFLRETVRVLERVLESFTPDDVRQLSDNIVFILETVKNMTQPEILSLVNRELSVVRQEARVEPIGPVGLVRAFRDPEVRRGFGILVQTLRELSSADDGRREDAIGGRERSGS